MKAILVAFACFCFGHCVLAQSSVALTVPCTRPLERIAKLMAEATYEPESISGYDEARSLLSSASRVCVANSDHTLWEAVNHLLRITMNRMVLQLTAAQEIVTADPNMSHTEIANSWRRAEASPKVQAIIGRQIGCESAILRLARVGVITEPVAECSLRPSE